MHYENHGGLRYFRRASIAVYFNLNCRVAAFKGLNANRLSPQPKQEPNIVDHYGSRSIVARLVRSLRPQSC